MLSGFFSQPAPPKPQVGIIHDFYIYMRSTAGLGCFCGGKLQGNLLLPRFYYLCPMMDILLLLAALVLAVTGIVGCIVPVIPGVILSYAGLLCAYGCSGSALTPAALWIWAAVTVVVSLVDYLLPGYLTRLFGGSRASVVGATLGVFAGFFLFPPIGIVVCPFLGR